VLGGAFMLGKKVVVQANIWGKAATFAFIIALALVFPWHGAEFLYKTGNILVIIATVMSIWAMVQYAYGCIKQLKNLKNA